MQPAPAAPALAAPADTRVHEHATATSARDSDVVPDLSAALVATAQAAIASPATRGAAIAAIGRHLEGTVVHPDQRGQIVWAYEAKGADYGLTVPYTNHPGGKITIYGQAFSSPSVLYTTIRHELLHLEQFRLRPDSQTDSKDYVVYQDLRLGDLPRAFLHAASEVETHAWEILHRADTGVDATFVTGRWTSLMKYWESLVKIAADAHLAAAKYDGYYRKARAAMLDAAASLSENIDTKDSIAALRSG
jgi:hypothetical protein